MADTTNTSLEDIIVPEVFTDYTTKRTEALSVLVSSGIAASNDALQSAAQGGGDTVTLPYWGDLPRNASQQLPDGNTDGEKLATRQITADKLLAVKLFRGEAWRAADMAGMVSGSDPMMSIGEGVAAYWAADEQTMLIAIMNGLFGAGGCLAATHVLDVSGGGRGLTGEVAIEAAALLGDAKRKFGTIAMHSLKHSALQAQNLIQYERDPESGLEYEAWMGYRVVMDDECPVAGGVYTSYLFGPGAIARATFPVAKATEVDRQSLEGNDVLISRRGLVLHPVGCRYVYATGGRSPTNTVLATASSWQKVWETKAIPLVAIKTR